MRFRFEHGGRSGIRDPEALGFALEQYILDDGRFGLLLVDFADTNDQPGELFRAKDLLISDLVKALALKHGAQDTTVRRSAMAELESMTPRLSQHVPGQEIPEKHWMYRLAKKYFFNDFGVYDKKAG